MKLLGNRIVAEEIEATHNSPIIVETKERFYKARVLASNNGSVVEGAVVLVDREKEQPIEWDGKKAVMFEVEDVIGYE